MKNKNRYTKRKNKKKLSRKRLSNKKRSKQKYLRRSPKKTTFTYGGSSHSFHSRHQHGGVENILDVPNAGLQLEPKLEPKLVPKAGLKSDMSIKEWLQLYLPSKNEADIDNISKILSPWFGAGTTKINSAECDNFFTDPDLDDYITEIKREIKEGITYEDFSEQVAEILSDHNPKASSELDKLKKEAESQQILEIKRDKIKSYKEAEILKLVTLKDKYKILLEGQSKQNQESDILVSIFHIYRNMGGSRTDDPIQELERLYCGGESEINKSIFDIPIGKENYTGAIVEYSNKLIVVFPVGEYLSISKKTYDKIVYDFDETLLDKISRGEYDKLIICGHSMGSALSYLMVIKLIRDSMIDPSKLFILFTGLGRIPSFIADEFKSLYDTHNFGVVDLLLIHVKGDLNVEIDADVDSIMVNYDECNSRNPHAPFYCRNFTSNPARVPDAIHANTLTIRTNSGHCKPGGCIDMIQEGYADKDLQLVDPSIRSKYSKLNCWEDWGVLYGERWNQCQDLFNHFYKHNKINTYTIDNSSGFIHPVDKDDLLRMFGVEYFNYQETIRGSGIFINVHHKFGKYYNSFLKLFK